MKEYLISQDFRGTQKDQKNRNSHVNCLIIVKWGKEQPKITNLALTLQPLAPRDEINMSADRGYFREPSVKRVSAHNNYFKQN